MGEIREMRVGEGDVKHIWDPDRPEEVEAARKTFRDLKNKGYRPFYVKSNGEKNGVMSEFDPDAGKIIMIPGLVGG